MPPIQYRNGQQIQNAQANTQISKEIQEISNTRLGRSARHFSNGYRSTQVFYRELAEQHFLERIEGQYAHGPGASGTLTNRGHRTVTDLANHLWRPIDSFDPGPHITGGCLALTAGGQRYRDVDLSTITLNAQHDFGIRMHTDNIDHLLPVIERLTIEGQQPIAGPQARRLRRPLRIKLGQDRCQCRTPRTNPQRTNRIRLVCALEPVI